MIPRSPGSTLFPYTTLFRSGWGGAVPSESLSFQREDEAKSFTVTLALPASARPGVYQVKAAAGASRERSEGSLAIIDYPHIRPRGVTHACVAGVRAARIALRNLEGVGFVRWAGCRVTAS